MEDDQMFACFLSYRHSLDPEAAKYVREFKKLLQKHVAARAAGLKVYLDEDYLVGGKLDPKLARALCRSACFVIYYSRFHFDPANPYCAREYQAMLALEQRRQAAVKKEDSLIITVARRDFERIPQELKDRYCYDFTNVLTEHDFSLKASQVKIDKIATEVANRWEDLRDSGLFSDGGCKDFALPEVGTFAAWLQRTSNRPSAAMPGH
jgi:hypothetical protein